MTKENVTYNFTGEMKNSITGSIIKDFLVTISDIWHMVNAHGYHIIDALQIEVCLHVTTWYTYINIQYIHSLSLERKL